MLWFGEKSGNIDRVDVAYPAGQEVMRTPTLSFRSVMIGADDQVTIGLERNFDTYFTEHKDRFYKSMFQEGLYTILIVFLVGLYSLNDIRLMVREEKRGKKGRFDKITSTSAESELFKKGLGGYS